MKKVTLDEANILADFFEERGDVRAEELRFYFKTKDDVPDCMTGALLTCTVPPAQFRLFALEHIQIATKQLLHHYQEYDQPEDYEILDELWKSIKEYVTEHPIEPEEETHAHHQRLELLKERVLKLRTANMIRGHDALRCLSDCWHWLLNDDMAITVAFALNDATFAIVHLLPWVDKDKWFADYHRITKDLQGAAFKWAWNS